MDYYKKYIKYKIKYLKNQNSENKEITDIEKQNLINKKKILEKILNDYKSPILDINKPIKESEQLNFNKWKLKVINNEINIRKLWFTMPSEYRLFQYFSIDILKEKYNDNNDIIEKDSKLPLRLWNLVKHNDNLVYICDKILSIKKKIKKINKLLNISN